MKCALVVGHKKESPGALNETGITEFEFNNNVAKEIIKKTTNTVLIYRTTAKNLPSDINSHKPDFIISLHCNAYNTESSGTEILYYHKSEKGRMIAEILQKNLCSVLKLRDRGVKPKTTEDRGGYLLKFTNAPCVIAEPFFIDNNEDLEVAAKKIKQLVKAYIKSIKEIAEALK